MKVNRSLKFKIIVAFTALYGFGSLYWISKTWMRVAGEFGEPTPHWLEKTSAPLHILSAFGFLFILGQVWSNHIHHAMRLKRHRASGWTFICITTALALSGVSILYFGQNKTIEQLHPLIGASLLPLLVFHWFSGRKKKRLR